MSQKAKERVARTAATRAVAASAPLTRLKQMRQETLELGGKGLTFPQGASARNFTAGVVASWVAAVSVANVVQAPEGKADAIKRETARITPLISKDGTVVATNMEQAQAGLPNWANAYTRDNSDAQALGPEMVAVAEDVRPSARRVNR